MYKIAVMGDYESIYGFSSIGLDIHPVNSSDEGKEKLRELIEDKVGIIYLTESLAKELSKEIEKRKTEAIPAIIIIPGTFGNSGIGVDGVKKSVEIAVGSDILFGDK